MDGSKGEKGGRKGSCAPPETELLLPLIYRAHRAVIFAIAQPSCGGGSFMNTFICQKAEQTDRQAGRQTNKLTNKTNK